MRSGPKPASPRSIPNLLFLCRLAFRAAKRLHFVDLSALFFIASGGGGSGEVHDVVGGCEEEGESCKQGDSDIAGGSRSTALTATRAFRSGRLIGA